VGAWALGFGFWFGGEKQPSSQGAGFPTTQHRKFPGVAWTNKQGNKQQYNNTLPTWQTHFGKFWNTTRSNKK